MPKRHGPRHRVECDMRSDTAALGCSCGWWNHNWKCNGNCYKSSGEWFFDPECPLHGHLDAGPEREENANDG